MLFWNVITSTFFHIKSFIYIYLYIYIYIYIYSKLATIVEGDPKAPFSLATKAKCRGERYSFPWIDLLYPWSLPCLCWVLSKVVSSTSVWVFGMTRPGIEPRSPVFTSSSSIIQLITSYNIYNVLPDQQEIIYVSPVRTRDLVWKTNRKWRERERERERVCVCVSRKSVLSKRLHDDDDDFLKESVDKLLKFYFRTFFLLIFH